MLEKNKHFLKHPIESCAKADINTIKGRIHNKLLLILTVVLSSCRFDVSGLPSPDANNNNNNLDAAVDARPIDDGSLDAGSDANSHQDSSVSDASEDSSVSDASFQDTGLLDAFVVDSTITEDAEIVQPDAEPVVEICTNGIDDNSNDFVDCVDAYCQSHSSCTIYTDSCSPLPPNWACSIGPGYICSDTGWGLCSQYSKCVCVVNN